MAQLHDLPTITSLSAECRETFCRLEIAFSSLEALPWNRSDSEFDLMYDLLIPVADHAGLRHRFMAGPPDRNVPAITLYIQRPRASSTQADRSGSAGA